MAQDYQIVKKTMSESITSIERNLLKNKNQIKFPLNPIYPERKNTKAKSKRF
jgi:hypothetical protein